MAVHLDKIDMSILKILQEDGRITNLDLSRKIDLSPAPTLERVRKLEQRGYLKSYHAMVDEERLGLGLKTFIQVRLDLHQADAIQKFLDSVSSISEVTECHHVTGQCDFILKAYVKDIKDYEKLITDKISKIGGIKNLQTMMILATNKKDMVVPLAYE